ncbi:hypothetical protein D3C76_75520 [compost metagenome]|nr:hypothetical protein [Paenibacillus timonensis]MUG88560.1 hypothetical protein [Paenibacillus timonensis]
MSIRALVTQLRQQTEELLALSTEDERYIERLEKLQLSRSEILDHINSYKESQQITRWPEDIESVFRKCYDMEMELLGKFQLQKEQASAEINKIGTARKVRELYGAKNLFNQGAYIDRNN